MTAPTDLVSERISFASDGLRLEGVFSYPADSQGDDLTILVCPHPCLGGDMDNNVILALEAEALRLGFATLRWNHRGVGESESIIPLETQIAKFWEDRRIHPESEPAVNDLNAAIDHALTAVGITPRRLFVIGYSFGSVVAMLAASQRTDITGLGMISPPIHQLDGDWPSPRVLTVLTRAGKDDIGVEETAHEALIKHLSPSVTSLTFCETDHFHRGQEEALASALMEALLAHQ